MNFSLPYVILSCFFLGIAGIQILVPLNLISRKILNVIVFLCFILFFGGRGFIGWDWTNYYPFYQNLYPISTFYLNDIYLDWGFTIYASILKMISRDFHFFIFVSFFIDACLLHIIFKRYLPDKYYALGFAVFLGFFGFILSTDLMRNIKSILLFLISLKYIEDRNAFKFFFLNIIALSFHWSSLVFLPMYFFLHRSISIRTFVIIFILGNIIFLFKIEYIKPILVFFAKILGGRSEEKILYYVSSSIYGKQYGLSFGYFERLFTSLLVIINYDKLLAQSKPNVFFVNSFIIFIVFSLYFAEVSIAINRLGALFVFSYWILIPMLLNCYSYKFFINFFLLLFYATLIIIKMNVLAGNLFYRYDNFIFGKTQSYKERKIIFEMNYKKIQK